MTTTKTLDIEYEQDPAHMAALDACRVHADRVTYALNQLPRDQVKTQLVRKFLSAQGWEIPRQTASPIVAAYRKQMSIADTAEQEALTDDVMADLDRLHVADIETGAPVDRQLETSEPTSTPEPEKLAPAVMPAEASEPAPAVAEPTAEQEKPDASPSKPSVIHRVAVGNSKLGKIGAAALLTTIGILLAGVIIAPIALSSQDIIHWAQDHQSGLGLKGPWPIITFLALDAAAAVCVGLVVYCAWRGEAPGVFAWLVWGFAFMSAYANYTFATRPGAPGAAWWFFPAMSIAGPFLLEVLTRRIRKWMQEESGQRARHSVSFGLARWIPGVGSFRDTYGAWRLARLDGLDDADAAVTAFRQLCPDGSLRIVKRLRTRDAS